ncbi:hypothetical protein JOM56_004287, partial [Amanita muscaria]
MLIKLVPESPHPSVLFAITFKNAPFEGFSEKAVVMSAGWASQLDTLVLDDLDLPTSLHVLDRAAGIPTIIQEVALDVPSRAIRCSFIDGSVEEWIWPFNSQTPTAAAKRPVTPISAYAMQQYMSAIEGIINNVAQSAVEDERERQKDMYSSQQQEQEHPGRTSSEYSPLPSSKSTVKTHKKQRSFFMNIVARPPAPSASSSSLAETFPLSSSHSSLKYAPSYPYMSQITVSPTVDPTKLSNPAARTLRRQARSALVDAFRRFVLPEIVGAGYYVWAIESMLRKASQRMDELANIAATTAVGAEKEKDRKTKSRIFPRDTTLNGDDTDSVETETDGSSVHTPSSGHESLPPPASKPAKGTLVAEGPSPGSLPPIEMAEYKALSRLSGKLQHLLFAAQARASQAENEARQRDATLEVRSQRRAWLNRTLRSWTPKSGGQGRIGNHTCTYGYISTCTMSTPNSSSPLARWTWTSEDWELASD